MKKTPRRALLDHAGRLYVLRQELAALRTERDRIEERIARTERKIAEAEGVFDAAYDAVAAGGQRRRHGSASEEARHAVSPGKLPHRVLTRMQDEPAKIHTAAELAAEFGIRDVQQVRTALARLVKKGLVRRAGVRGEFTV